MQGHFLSPTHFQDHSVPFPLCLLDMFPHLKRYMLFSFTVSLRVLAKCSYTCLACPTWCCQLFLYHASLCHSANKGKDKYFLLILPDVHVNASINPNLFATICCNLITVCHLGTLSSGLLSLILANLSPSLGSFRFTKGTCIRNLGLNLRLVFVCFVSESPLSEYWPSMTSCQTLLIFAQELHYVDYSGSSGNSIIS